MAEPIKGVAYTFSTPVIQTTNPDKFYVNPPLAAGNFSISQDGGPFAPLTNTPTVVPAGSILIEIVLTAAEMNYDRIYVRGTRPGNVWNDFLIELRTTTRGIDDLAYPTVSGQALLVDGSGFVTANGVQGNVTGNVSGSVGGSVGSVLGDVGGKVIGGGASLITGPGVWAYDNSGNVVAPASSALSNVIWTNAKAAFLDVAISSRMPVGNVTVGGYAAGQDPATYVLITPANRLLTDPAGQVVASSVVGSISGSVAGVSGDITGKVLGGGVGVIVGTGARADLSANTIDPTKFANDSGSVIADAGNTTTSFKTNLPSVVDNFYVNRLLKFTSSSIAGELARVISYNGTTKFITVFTPFTVAPALGNFTLLNI